MDINVRGGRESPGNRVACGHRYPVPVPRNRGRDVNAAQVCGEFVGLQEHLRHRKPAPSTLYPLAGRLVRKLPTHQLGHISAPKFLAALLAAQTEYWNAARRAYHSCAIA